MLKQENILKAQQRLNGVIETTPLSYCESLSKRYNANIFLKREDLQRVRSYKIRGAYNKIASLDKFERGRGVICASAGNHAQGVAYSCHLLKIEGNIYMPVTTPKQKINQVKLFGGEYIKIILDGDTFDDSAKSAQKACKESNMVFIHPFDDYKVIEGQATVGLEIIDQSKLPIDYLFMPIGGGGLASGVGSYMKIATPKTKLIGVEPIGAAGMKASIDKKEITTLKHIDKFVDGAAVKRVGEITFKICNKVLDDIVTVAEGKVCTTILEMYNINAIVVEPAGALSIAALDLYKDSIEGKTVVCIVSGSNNDITRMEEIKERSLLYERLKHYFIIHFPQRAGSLHNFVSKVLGDDDDITYFEYKKKTYKERGPALVGIEISQPENFDKLIDRMDINSIEYEYMNDNPILFEFLI